MSSEILLIPASEYHSLKKEVMSIKGLVEQLIDQLKKAEQIKNENYLSTTEACDKYRISKPTLMGRSRLGFITPLKTGRTVRWAESDLQRLFDKR